jgi:hypothetical protein
MPWIPPTSQSENSVATPRAVRPGGEGGRRAAGAGAPEPVMSRARVARAVGPGPAPAPAPARAEDAERADDVERAVCGGEGGATRALLRNTAAVTASGAPVSAKRGGDG